MSYPQYGGFSGPGGSSQQFNGRPPMQHGGGRMPFSPQMQPMHRGPRGGMQQQQFMPPGQNPFMQNMQFGQQQQQQPGFFPSAQQMPNGQFDFSQSGGAPQMQPGQMPVMSLQNPYGIPSLPPGLRPSVPLPPSIPFGGPPAGGQTFRAAPPPPGIAAALKDRRSAKTYPYPSSSEQKSDYDPETVVTIFIGNIDERVSESLIRILIQKCGNVANWKRVHGANNKLQAFGFCDFSDAESALRAIRLLDKIKLGAKELQVKIGNKCHPMILAYKTQMKTRLGADASEDDVDESTLRQDQIIKEDLECVIDEHEEELTKPLPEDSQAKLKRKPDKEATIEEIEMEEEKRQLISREIQNFRDTYKGSDEVLEERIKAAGRAQRKEIDRNSPDSTSSVENASVKSAPKRQKSRSVSVHSSTSSDDVATLPTKAKYNKRLLEQEKLYREQLEEWLIREKRKAEERKREDAREKAKRSEERKTAKRLIRVYEDYDDEKMDEEYYSGAALSRLLKDRKKELEADERDREKETKVLDELKLQLIQDGHPAAEAHILRVEMEQNKHMISEGVKDAVNNALSRQQPPPATLVEEKTVLTEDVPPVIDTQSQRENTTIIFQQATSRLVKRAPTGEMFGISDDEGERDDHGERRRRLFRFDDETERKRQIAEQKKVQAKKLIENIPTKKEELFDYTISWEILDKGLMDGRVKPWISKKIQEYIGEEEQTLVEFIAQKVVTKANPRGIIQDISMVLDEDAEIFVVKLWRLLIYETEMKKLGLLVEQ